MEGGYYTVHATQVNTCGQLRALLTGVNKERSNGAVRYVRWKTETAMSDVYEKCNI